MNIAKEKDLVNAHDVAVLTAWREKLVNVTDKTLLTSSCTDFKEDMSTPEKPLCGGLLEHENQYRNRNLKAALLLLNYGITPLWGNFVKFCWKGRSEYRTDIPLKIENYFVVNIHDDPNFYDNVFRGLLKIKPLSIR